MGKRTLEEKKLEFVRQAQEKFGDKFDYSNVEYKGKEKKVEIICKRHGHFWQTPYCHLLSEYGCRKCATERRAIDSRFTTKEFIEKSRKVHGDKYDYSQTFYKTSVDDVKIICPEHGAFEQKAIFHMRGGGCPVCGVTKRRDTKEEFINKAIKKYGDKYDYSKVKYVNSRVDVEIVCKEHGVFKLPPKQHLHGRICPECSVYRKRERREESIRHNLELEYIIKYQAFIKDVFEKFGNAFSFDSSSYIGYSKKMRIKCQKHGWFERSPSNFIKSVCGCPKCGKEHAGIEHRLTTEQFIELAKKVHGNKYSYEKSKYIQNSTPVTITCRVHGDFEQTPHEHLGGCGCKKCKNSTIENRVNLLLDELGITYEKEKQFDWLKNKLNMRLDFYVPSRKIAIECQGD